MNTEHTTKYLFLDIDEVLNGEDTEYFIPGLHSQMEPLCSLHIGNQWLCPIRIGQLNKALDAVPDTRIILSSTWREYGIRSVQDALKRNGFRYQLRGATPPRTYPKLSRDMEISAWFERQNIDFRTVQFVILDDLPMDIITAFRSYHVQTSGVPDVITHDDGRVEPIGFSDVHVNHIIEILKSS